MSTANEHVFSHGMRDTRETLELWSDRPGSVLGGWVALSLAIALTLLGAVWVVSGLLTPDLTPIHLPGLTEPSTPGDMLPILWRNSLVLALHATACVAGFIAGASMPIAAAQRPASRAGSTSRRGRGRSSSSAPSPSSRSAPRPSTSASRARRSPTSSTSPTAALILSVLPHALLELTALFLPLAAWLIASRRGEWNQLLAATFVTVLIAIPALILAAAIEVYLWPHILESLSSGFSDRLD